MDKILLSQTGISLFKSLGNNIDEFRQSYSRIEVYIETSITAPLREELVFRLMLVASPYLLDVGLLLTFISMAMLAYCGIVYELLIDRVLLFILFLRVVFRNPAIMADSIVFDKRAYNYLCWASIMFFSVLHIVNFFPLNYSVFYLYPFYVLPQFISGVAMSFLAVRYNSILWPFLLHVAINSTTEIVRFATWVVDFLIRG